MAKNKMPDIFISPDWIIKQANKRGVELESKYTTCPEMEIAGQLMGKVKVELDKILDKLALLQEIKEADTEFERMEILINNLELLR